MGKDIFEKIDAHLQNHRMGAWTRTFRGYVERVIKQPILAQQAHARLYNMIKAAGVEVDEESKEHYPFFEHDLFGINEPLARVVEYFKAAALGSDAGRRVLLLYGPSFSGKSQLAVLLKRGLEAYTQTEAGAMYVIADCPQHEEPLNLLPHALHQEFQEETGIHVEGELCPLCALHLRDKYQGDIYRVPVKQMFFSEKERLGIGTFVPSDPKSQDISELVGSIDLSTVGDYGSESDPRAYRLVERLNLFAYGSHCTHPPGQPCTQCQHIVITSRVRDAVVEALLAPRCNYGGAAYHFQEVTTNTLYLEHLDRATTYLDRQYATNTLTSMTELWKQPVHLLTSDERGQDTALTAGLAGAVL